jgi:hypothetical protein
LVVSASRIRCCNAGLLTARFQFCASTCRFHSSRAAAPLIPSAAAAFMHRFAMTSDAVLPRSSNHALSQKRAQKKLPRGTKHYAQLKGNQKISQGFFGPFLGEGVKCPICFLRLAFFYVPVYMQHFPFV